MLLSYMLEADNRVDLPASFVAFSNAMLDSRPNLERQEQLSPERLICFQIIVVQELSRGAHGERIFEQ